MIHQGLRRERLTSILDNSDFKEGKRLYGTSLKVENPNAIQKFDKVAVIVKAGQYQTEVVEQLKKINENVCIWE